VCGPREPQWERMGSNADRRRRSALYRISRNTARACRPGRIPPPYPLGRSSEATFTSTRQRSGNGTSSCIASGSTVDLSLHESDCHLPTRPPHPRKSPPLCYFSLTARDLLIHYAWRYHCFVEYTLEGLTAAVSRPSLNVVIRFSDPKSAFSIQLFSYSIFVLGVARPSAAALVARPTTKRRDFRRNADLPRRHCQYAASTYVSIGVPCACGAAEPEID
jgi:hypothetical protein